MTTSPCPTAGTASPPQGRTRRAGAAPVTLTWVMPQNWPSAPASTARMPNLNRKRGAVTTSTKPPQSFIDYILYEAVDPRKIGHELRNCAIALAIGFALAYWLVPTAF